MTTKKAVDYLVYALVIILSAIALAMVANAPPDFIKNVPVYKGF